MQYVWHKGFMSLIYKEILKINKKKMHTLFLAVTPHSNQNGTFKTHILS